MSVVVVRKYDDQIDIASDSQVSFGSNFVSESKESKLFQCGSLVVGTVGSAAPISLMNIYMKKHQPKSATIEGIVEFMHDFRTWLASHHSICGDEENEYIFVVDDKVFWEAQYYVKEIDDYFAIGSGTDFCLAAMYLGHDVTDAVKAACAHSMYCCEPVNIVSLKKPTGRRKNKRMNGDEG